MEKVHNTNTSKSITAILFILLMFGGFGLRAQLTTAFFTPEATCSAADINTFLMADVAGEVGSARYSSLFSLSGHLEIEAKFKFTGIGSAGFVVGTVPSIPASAYSTTTGGWPNPMGKIILRMDRGTTASSLKLVVNGFTVWTLAMPSAVMGTCQAVKLNLIPSESGLSHIKVTLNDVPRISYPVNYKSVVFSGASSTSFRVWGVALANAPVFASFNGVCADETASVTPLPPSAPKPPTVKGHKTKHPGLVVAGASAVIITIADAIFGKHMHSKEKLVLMKP